MDAGLEAVFPSGWKDEQRVAGGGGVRLAVLRRPYGSKRPILDRLEPPGDRGHDTCLSGKVCCGACSSRPTLSAAACDGAPCQTESFWRPAGDRAGAVRGVAPLRMCQRRLIARLSM